jgi:hypothetical protein
MPSQRVLFDSSTKSLLVLLIDSHSDQLPVHGVTIKRTIPNTKAPCCKGLVYYKCDYKRANSSQKLTRCSASRT